MHLLSRMVKFGYNPFALGSESYIDFELRREKAGQKKPNDQIKDEERYEGSTEKFWEYNEIWKKEQAKRKEKEENGDSRKEYFKQRYQNKKKEVKK